MSERSVERVIAGVATSDGAGVSITRSLGMRPHDRLDPFLMLDEFGSDDPSEYIAGFPPHPHRGFETVTYMLEGEMLHEDHLGNRGRLSSGGVQWMTAGRGIIHSEMPQQREGRMRGFQLWLNLPAAEKMKPASYRDIEPDAIPALDLDAGGRVRVITGRLSLGDAFAEGPVRGITTDPTYLDVTLPPHGALSIPVAAGHNALVYVFEGAAVVGRTTLRSSEAGLLSDGDSAAATACDAGARFLLLAARPIGEPVVQHGPFVMNSAEEIEQAIRDYQAGVLTG